MAKASPAELAQRELEWRRCFPKIGASVAVRIYALIYFVSTYCFMWEKIGGAPIRWVLWDCQRDMFAAFIRYRLVIILKTRQLGASWTACAYTLWRVMERGNVHAYFQSIGMVEVTEQHERIKFIYDNLPDWMRARCELGGKGKKRNDRLSQFQNGSAVHLYATTKRSGHGAAPALWVLDEFARNELDQKTLRAVLPAVGEVGQVIMISTADGLGNAFHQTWLQAENSDTNWHPMFFPASSHPKYTPEFLERERLNYSGDEVGYHEAYPSSASEAFQTSSRCPFSGERIRECGEYILQNNIRPEVGTLRLDDGMHVIYEEDRRGHYSIWKKPVPAVHATEHTAAKRAHRYTLGADVAEGIAGGDYSVAVVLDSETNEVVAMYRGRVAPENYSLPLRMLATYYNMAWLAFEVNKNGDIIGRDLKESYPNLYMRERRAKIWDEPTYDIGFYTSVATKPLIITGLRREFHSEENPIRIYSDTILGELNTYEERPNGTMGAGRGYYDDCVMALAIAIEARKTQPIKRKKRPERRLKSGQSL